jgi:hypothetical protein
LYMTTAHHLVVVITCKTAPPHLEVMTTDPSEDIGIKTCRHLEVEMTDFCKINNIKVTTVIDKDMRIVGAGRVIRVMMMILLNAQLMVMSGIDQEIVIDNTSTGNARYSRLKLKKLTYGRKPCPTEVLLENNRNTLLKGLQLL